MIMPSKLPLNNIRKLLIRSTNWIGDAVMTSPAVRSLRHNFPLAELHVLARPWVAQVFAYSPHIDRIIIYDNQGIHRGLRGKIRLSGELSRQGYDAVILLQNAFEAAFIAYLARIPIRIGFNTDGRAGLLTHSVQRPASVHQLHQTCYYLSILSGVGLSVGNTELELFVTQAERRQAEAIIQKQGIGAGFIGVNPGAAYGTAKRWLPERFIELIRLMTTEFKISAVIFGGTSEQELGEYIAFNAGKRCVNLCGKTTLRETIALIDQCAVFVTNDSGLMHLAAALNKPQVAIFGSTDHITTAPLSPAAVIVKKQTPCSPCLKPECPTDHRCMKNISVEMVLNKTRTLLNISTYPDR